MSAERDNLGPQLLDAAKSKNLDEIKRILRTEEITKLEFEIAEFGDNIPEEEKAHPKDELTELRESLKEILSYAGEDGNTALHIIINELEGNFKLSINDRLCVANIVLAGANLCAKDTEGNVPVLLAAKRDAWGAVSIMLGKDMVTGVYLAEHKSEEVQNSAKEVDIEGRNLYSYVGQDSFEDLLNEVVDKTRKLVISPIKKKDKGRPNSEDQNKFLDASRSGNVKEIRELLEKYQGRESELVNATEKRKGFYFKDDKDGDHFKDRDSGEIKRIGTGSGYEHGRDQRYSYFRYESGYTPLHYAASKGHAEVVSVLLDNKAKNNPVILEGGFERQSSRPSDLARNNYFNDIGARIKDKFIVERDR